MFNLKSKIILGAVTIVAAFLFFPGGKVSAANDCNDWAPENGSFTNPSQYWGIASGETAHGMSGLRVRAHNAKNGNMLNVGYELRSKLPPGNYDLPNGINNKNARIFKWPLGSGRDDQHWFQTGERIRFNGTLPGGGGGGASTACNGWSVLGPGNTADCPPRGPWSVPCIFPGGKIAQWGNGWVLDCQEFDESSGQLKAVRFWISNITKPGGQAGKWGGHWTIKIVKRGSVVHSGTQINKRFVTANGETTHISLIWHPNPPPPPPPGGGPVVGRCENLTVHGWGSYDTHNTNGNPRYRDTRTYVRVTDQNGGVIVPGPGDNRSGNGQFAILNGGPGPPNYNESKTWHYKNKLKTKKIKIQVIRKWHKRNGPNYFWHTDPGWNKTNTYTCFQASCDLSMLGNVSGRSDGVKSHSQFPITASAKNNASSSQAADRLYATIDGRPLILAITSGVGTGRYFNPAAPHGLPRNVTASETFYVNEPGWSIGNYNVKAKLYYDFNSSPGIQGNDLVLADCDPTDYDVYKQFGLEPNVNIELNPSVEDPKKVIFEGHADPTGPGIPTPNGKMYVDYSATSKRKPFGGSTQTLDNSSGRGATSIPYSHTYNNPPSSEAGDQYSLDPFCIAQTSGWVGPPNGSGNRFSSDTTGSCTDDDVYVYDRPYLHVYGSDAVAGNGFRTGDTCTSDGGSQGIRAFRSTEGGKGGSGAQLAALAFGGISGFGSASTRSSAPQWPVGLTFANTGVTINNGPGGQDRPNDGGNYSGESICSKDFYSDLEADEATAVSSPISAGSLPTGQQSFSSGNIVINGGSPSGKAALFVNGNVFINGNINFGAGSYLTIVAKGNIYVHKNVTQLDGLYVAQPKNDGTRGVIYTCANGGNPVALANLYNECRTQLVVNGAFVAKDIEFLRVANSLRASQRGEVPNFDNGTGTPAAEVFNFSPEVYLYYDTVFDSDSTGQPYQYLTTLPPVL